MIVQKGTQRIEVIIRKDTSGVAGANPSASDDVSSENNEQDKLDNGYKRYRKKRIAITNTTHALATAKQVGGMILNYYIGGVGIESGDAALQQRMERQLEIVEDYTNFGTSIARGAIFGAWGGGIGIAVGMATAAVTSGASIGLKYMNRRREYNYKVFKETNAIEYRRARASINMTTGRLR